MNTRLALQCAAALFALATATITLAQSAPRSYAVVSEVARQVRVVNYQPSVGKVGNNNRVQRVDVPDGALDKVFLFSAQQELKSSGAADIWLLAPSDSDFFGPAVFSDGGSVTLPEDLKAALNERKSTHLLVFTRQRADGELRFDNLTESTGPLEGLGYYVDNEFPVRQVDKRELVYGYLASYAFFRATLIDVNAQRVVKTLSTRASRITTAASSGAKDAHPWMALSPAEKMMQLRDLTQREVRRMVPELVKP